MNRTRFTLHARRDSPTIRGVTGAAFFDLDKTILGTTSSLAFTKPLYEQGLIKRADVVRSAYRQFIFTISAADHQQMEQMREYLSALVTGWDVDQLSAIVQETLDEVVAPTVHAEAMKLLDFHRQAGRKIIIVSASGNEIVEPVARMLNADDAIATRLEVFNGKYTGDITFYAYGENKAVAMREYAQTYGIDLAQSYAYSDSITDLPMLEVVGKPCAVNPDSALREIAGMRGWPILTFEKPIAMRRPIIDDPEQRKKALITLGVVAAVGGVFAMSKRSKRRRDVT